MRCFLLGFLSLASDNFIATFSTNTLILWVFSLEFAQDWITFGKNAKMVVRVYLICLCLVIY